MVLHRLFLSFFPSFFPSLRNESCIRFFRPTILIPVVNFPFLSPYLPHHLFLRLSLSAFFSCTNVASSSSSAELLFQLLAHLRILGLLISCPSPSSLSLAPRVVVELNRAQQPVLQTKKGFRRCPSRPPSPPSLFSLIFRRIPTFSLLSAGRLCVVLRRRGTPPRRPPASRAELLS